MNNTKTSFHAEDTLRSLIQANHLMLMVIRRFGICLGFGDSRVADICERSGIDTDTFLAVANFIDNRPYSKGHIALPSLIEYLRSAHTYFLDFALPAIRRKLLEALPVASSSSSLTMLFLKYFDDYVAEVKRHMDYENRHVFPYIENLLAGQRTSRFNIAEFEAKHRPLAPRLRELKEIFIFHYEGSANDDLLTSALFDIITCEQDLLSHCGVEDAILVPAVEELETSGPRTPANVAQQSDELTAREIEIVKCIAMGLASKEIADKLFLSVHTVNTHRRNICSKLDIHSAPALTIYAILHNLVDIKDIKAAN